MPKIRDRIQNAWNAFIHGDSLIQPRATYTGGSYNRPDRFRFTRGNERSIVNSIYNKIAIDCASIHIEHVRLDEDGRFLSAIDSGLNNCLTLSANRDQTGRAFIQDVVMSLLDEGSVAIVPTDVDENPGETDSYDILTMRTGKIVAWYPTSVRVSVYNENKGEQEEITLPKDMVALVENPFYSIMNEPNSTIKRLVRKLALLDGIDEQSSAGKLDLIIQLPYVVKNDTKRQQAEIRRKEVEEQLVNSKYGVAYTDGTEKITQLNRPLENHLLEQIQFLTDQAFAQLGFTTEILNGTADETVMTNYFSRIIEPILSAIVDEFKRKFLTKTARSQRQSIVFFRDPFKLVPVSSMAEIADKMTRNEIMSTNEVRQHLGMRPVDDPKANELRNKNLNAEEDQTFASTSEGGYPEYE